MRRFGVRIPTVSPISNQIPDESWGFLVLVISHSHSHSHSHSVSPTHSVSHSVILMMVSDERKREIKYDVKKCYQRNQENFLSCQS